MKPRTVILTLEVITDAPLSLLRTPSTYNESCWDIEVIQAQANVQQKKKP